MRFKLNNGIKRIFVPVIVLYLVSLVHNTLLAQDQPDIEDNLGWKIALNAGLYLPNHYHASFYNGTPKNENTIGYILDNKYHFMDIMNILEASDTFLLYALPERMRYEPALCIGFTLRNNFREDWSWYFMFNQTTLIAKDVFTLRVDPLNIGVMPDLRSYPIWGKEKRFIIDLGFTKEKALLNSNHRPFVEFGATFTNTLVIEHKISIEEKDFNLINIYGTQSYIPNSGLQTFEVEQGGLGFGVHANIGIKLIINDYFSLDPAMHFYINSINLNKYNHIKPHLYFNLRLSINNLFLFSTTQQNSKEQDLTFR